MNIKTNNNNTFNLAVFVRCTFQVRNQSKNVYEKFTACEQSKTESYSWFSIHIVSCDTKHRYAFRMSQVLVGVVKMIVAQRFSERISLKCYMFDRAVSCTQNLGGGGWGYLSSLPDNSYDPANSYCIVLTKLLFNELPIQNLGRHLPDAGYSPV